MQLVALARGKKGRAETAAPGLPLLHCLPAAWWRRRFCCSRTPDHAPTNL